MFTAVKDLEIAHDATFCIAKRAAAVLAAHEGLGVTLTRAEIAASVGLDLRDTGVREPLFQRRAERQVLV